MKKLMCLFTLVSLVYLAGCSGSMNSINDDEDLADGQSSSLKPSYVRLDQAQQSVALALEYHDQAGFEQSAELFIEAADLFAELELKDEERRALIAAAKMQIKHSRRQAFLFTMARYKGLLQRYEMPAEDERFLINLSDHLKNNPLTFPVKSDWKLIFNN